MENIINWRKIFIMRQEDNDKTIKGKTINSGHSFDFYFGLENLHFLKSLIMYVSYHKVETEISALLHKVLEGEEIIILRHNKPVAKISPLKETSKKRKIGSAKGLIHTSEDFDAPLDEMKDYMY